MWFVSTRSDWLMRSDESREFQKCEGKWYYSACSMGCLMQKPGSGLWVRLNRFHCTVTVLLVLLLLSSPASLRWLLGCICKFFWGKHVFRPVNSTVVAESYAATSRRRTREMLLYVTRTAAAAAAPPPSPANRCLTLDCLRSLVLDLLVGGVKSSPYLFNIIIVSLVSVMLCALPEVALCWIAVLHITPPGSLQRRRSGSLLHLLFYRLISAKLFCSLLVLKGGRKSNAAAAALWRGCSQQAACRRVTSWLQAAPYSMSFESFFSGVRSEVKEKLQDTRSLEAVLTIHKQLNKQRFWVTGKICNCEKISYL